MGQGGQPEGLADRLWLLGRTRGAERDDARPVQGDLGKLAQPDLEIGKGQQEGAVGSSFYSVPVTIVDGARRIPGEVVFRRVNDVDGATAEQLRWHIESTTLKP